MYKLMIVDDEYYTIMGLKKFLLWEDYNIEICATAQSGMEAIEKVKETQPDIIITDICMKAMDGLSMIEQLKNEGFAGELIIMSGYKVFEYAQRAIYDGVSSYLLKPLSRENLISVIQKSCKNLEKNQHIKKAEEFIQVQCAQNDQDPYTKKMDEILKFMDDHYKEDISLNTLVNKFHIEQSYLSKLFKMNTGKTYMEIITLKRMNKAKYLLKNTYLTIYEIAHEVSYEDQKYFSNLFRRIEGMTPSEYRLQEKEKSLDK